MRVIFRPMVALSNQSVWQKWSSWSLSGEIYMLEGFIKLMTIIIELNIRLFQRKRLNFNLQLKLQTLS